MWIFGHLGIGSKLASPLSRKLPYGWLLLGTLLPDLIDKPLFYGLKLAVHSDVAQMGIITCTRTFGHTGLLILGICLLAILRKSKPLAAVALGMATHLVLDGFQDHWSIHYLGHEGPSSTLLAVLFPFYESHFAAMQVDSFTEHAATLKTPLVLIAEVFGILFLMWDYWKWKHLLSALKDRLKVRIRKRLRWRTRPEA